MSVSHKHPDFVRMEKTWRRCRDVYAGTDAMRAATTKYLPMLTDELGDAYMARLGRTVLYNAFYRTVSGMVGMLFRRPAVLDAPEYTTSLMDDVTLTGIPLNVLAQEIAEECLVVGRCGIYCNYPIADTENMTQADALAYNLRPSLSTIKAEQIINWKQKRISNKYVLSLAVVKEEFLEAENEFKDKPVIRYRVLDLEDYVIPNTGMVSVRYRVRIMEEDDKGNDILIEGPFYPMMNGITMNFIPLTIVGPDDITPDIDVPIMTDLCDINITHYQNLSDLINGSHWSGCPTMVVTGYAPPDGSKLTVGAGKALVLSDPAAKVYMVEVGTGGFVALEKMLNRIESNMVTLGSRLLEAHKVQAESAELAQIYRSGESSILSALGISVSTGITIALKTFSAWAGDNPDEVRFTLNNEFFASPVDANMLKELVAAWQLSGISAEAKFEFLQKNEFYPPHITFDSEEKRIKEGSPKTPTKPAIITKISRTPDGGMVAERQA